MARPSRYVKPKTSIKEPEYQQAQADRLLELLTNGVLNSGCMAELGICEDTFYVWVKEHQDFGAAYRIGRPRCEWFHARRLDQMAANGDDKGCKAQIMILNNNFGWNKGAAQGNLIQNTINIQGNMNVLGQKSTDELLELIQNNTEYLQLNNVLALPTSPKDKVIEGEIISNGSKE